MESDINDEIYEKLRKSVQGGPSTSPLKGFFEKSDFSVKMAEISKLYNVIINNTEYLKCILVLSMKKVNWKKRMGD